MNLSDALDANFKSISKRIRSLIEAKTKDFLEISGYESVYDNKLEKIKTTVINKEPNKDVTRLETFDNVKELQTKRIPTKTISRDMKMSRNTVRSYLCRENWFPGHTLKQPISIYSQTM